MQGEQVRKKLISSGYIMKDIAESMNETPQNFNMLLHAKDIKTGTLERICLAINVWLVVFGSSANPQILPACRRNFPIFQQPGQVHNLIS